MYFHRKGIGTQNQQIGFILTQKKPEGIRPLVKRGFLDFIRCLIPGGRNAGLAHIVPGQLCSI